MSVSVIRTADLTAANELENRGEASKPSSVSSELLKGVRISLEVRLGNATMTVEQMMTIKQGSVLPLEVGLVEHAELYLNDILVARAEIVAVGDKFGVRIVEIAPAP